MSKLSEADLSDDYSSFLKREEKKISAQLHHTLTPLFTINYPYHYNNASSVPLFLPQLAVLWGLRITYSLPIFTQVEKKNNIEVLRGDLTFIAPKNTHKTSPSRYSDIIQMTGAVDTVLSDSACVCVCVSAVVLCCVGRCRHSGQVFIQPGLRTGLSPAAIGRGGGGGGEDGGGVAWRG